MQITFELPDEDVRVLQTAGIDPTGRAKEALLADLVRARRKQREAADRPNLTREFWCQLDPEIRGRFAAGGITEEDFEAAAQGIRPLPKSESDRRIAESIRELENTEPNMVLHLADILFVSCEGEHVPTLRQFLSKTMAKKMDEDLRRQMQENPLAFRQMMDGLLQQKKALFHDLTSRNGGPGGEGKTTGGPREEP